MMVIASSRSFLHFRIVVATLAWIWQVPRALVGSVRFWMVIACVIL